MLVSAAKDRFEPFLSNAAEGVDGWLNKNPIRHGRSEDPSSYQRDLRNSRFILGAMRCFGFGHLG
jgi:hypothetical protein